MEGRFSKFTITINTVDNQILESHIPSRSNPQKRKKERTQPLSLFTLVHTLESRDCFSPYM